jgi:uncharacterized protein (DUF362 family)
MSLWRPQGTPHESDIMAQKQTVGCCGITRRGFLLGAVAGFAAGVPAAWYGSRWWRDTGEGRYPGRVVRVHDRNAVGPNHTANEEIVKKMVDRGLVDLVNGDAKDPKSAWKRFFERGDVVGIKVNPVGRAPKPGDTSRVAHAVGCISNHAIVVACVEGLKSAGVRPQDIVVFERYAEEFKGAGYLDLMGRREMAGVRWMASADAYTDTQLDLEGFDAGRDACPADIAAHVAGYDPDVFAHMGFCAPQHDKKDDRRFRSHLSVIVSRMVNKIITIPCLKDHRSAGVTLALKNMSHGMNNNVARSHVSKVTHGVFGEKRVLGPNQCNTFIPHAVSSLPLRQKATLHILDGLVGVYEGGPGCWNRTWGTWDYKSLLFATDPVAMDHVGWDIIDSKRAEMGWAPVARMGLSAQSPVSNAASELAALAGYSPLDAVTLGMSAQNLREGRASEDFDLRTPQHISLAGDLGLGVFDPQLIDYRTVKL